MGLYFQSTVFLASFAAGAVSCFFFGVYNNLAKSLRLKGSILLVLDVYFWIKTTIFTFSLLQVFAHGTVRGFVFLGFGCGWFFLHTGKRFVSDILREIICFARK